MSLSLGHVPVHLLPVGWDHLIYRAMTSTSRAASIPALVGSTWGETLGLQVLEVLVKSDIPRQAGGCRMIVLPRSWLGKGSREGARETSREENRQARRDAADR